MEGDVGRCLDLDDAAGGSLLPGYKETRAGGGFFVRCAINLDLATDGDAAADRPMGLCGIRLRIFCLCHSAWRGSVVCQLGVRARWAVTRGGISKAAGRRCIHERELSISGAATLPLRCRARRRDRLWPARLGPWRPYDCRERDQGQGPAHLLRADNALFEKAVGPCYQAAIEYMCCEMTQGRID